MTFQHVSAPALFFMALTESPYCNPVLLVHLFLCCLLTEKFPNFRMPENFAVIYLNSYKEAKPKGIYQNDANGIANSEDPDQTALQGAV